MQAIAFDFKSGHGVFVDASREGDSIFIHRVEGVERDVRGTASFADMDNWISLKLSGRISRRELI